MDPDTNSMYLDPQLYIYKLLFAHPGVVLFVSRLTEQDHPDDDEPVHAHHKVGLQHELGLAAPVYVGHASALAAVYKGRAPDVVPHLPARGGRRGIENSDQKDAMKDCHEYGLSQHYRYRYRQLNTGSHLAHFYQSGLLEMFDKRF